MYDILWEDKPVGRAQIKKEGLYYCVCCTCSPPDSRVYRVVADDGIRYRDLGICVPDGLHFTLSTRVACKKLNADNLSFLLVCNPTERNSIPVENNTEFAYLDKLETARLQVTNGRTEILID